MIVKDIDKNGLQFRLILVDDLNPEDVAMVCARKARSGESSVGDLETIYAARRAAFGRVLYDAKVDEVDDELLDALMAVSSHNDASALARRFNQKWLVGYGHKSIADCATGCTLIIEGVSMLAAKAFEHHPLFAGQETSTRAVDMSVVRLVDPIGTAESRAVHERCMEFYRSSWDATADEVRRRYPRRADEDEAKYEDAVKYRTFDILRAWIPAGATTHVAITMNLRQFGDHLTNLLLHPLAEVREIALAMQSTLRERYPSSGSFGNAAGVSGVGIDGREAEREAWRREVSMTHFGSYQRKKIMFSNELDLPFSLAFGFEDNLVTAEVSESDVGELVLRRRPRGCELPAALRDLGTVSFRFPLDFGSYRDLERQRSCSIRMPPLTPWAEGFEPWYLEQLPEALREEANNLIALIDRSIGAMTDVRMLDAQYLVPMGFRVPVDITATLPAFAYVVELRSGATVHPTVRKAVLEYMVKPFRKAHPEVLLHVDESEDPWDLRRGQHTITEKGA